MESQAGHIIDLRRGLDYLETRDDVDTSRIAFAHGSAGGMIMALPAIEKRYRAVILWGAQLNAGAIGRGREASFMPLIEAPKLLIHGRYDETVPLKPSAEPPPAPCGRPRAGREHLARRNTRAC